MNSNKHILLTIDVEDWFQVENFKPWIPFYTWDQRELRVERNVHRLLDLFDSIELNTQGNELNQLNQPSNISEAYLFDSCEVAGKPGSLEVSDPQPIPINKQRTAPNKQQTTDHIQTKKIKATFFVLGWLVDRFPNIVREIQSRGHEIASHGCCHELPEFLSADELKQDLTDSKKLLEDITGAPISGYRAPSFAINDDILKIIEDAGYLYDSSYNSFGLHGRYGRISLNGTCKKGVAHKISDNFFELPISNLMINGWVLPWGGGGYFRLAPYQLFRYGVEVILKKNDAYIFYMHPWELDPNQPSVKNASMNYKFRHYTNLNKTKSRLKRLIENFDQCRFVTCNEYLFLTTSSGLHG